MKRLLFKMYKDKELIINEELTYYVIDNKMNIKNDTELYKIDLNNHIFMKKNQESFIIIDFKKKIMHLDILDNDLHFDIDLLKSKFSINKSIIEFSYMLDDGENVLNKIEINY